MKIAKVRSLLYKSAKVLGDVQAVKKSADKRSATPLVDRARRRLVGRLVARLIH